MDLEGHETAPINQAREPSAAFGVDVERGQIVRPRGGEPVGAAEADERLQMIRPYVRMSRGDVERGQILRPRGGEPVGAAGADERLQVDERLQMVRPYVRAAGAPEADERLQIVGPPTSEGPAIGGPAPE